MLLLMTMFLPDYNFLRPYEQEGALWPVAVGQAAFQEDGTETLKDKVKSRIRKDVENSLWKHRDHHHIYALQKIGRMFRSEIWLICEKILKKPQKFIPKYDDSSGGGED